MDSGRLTEWYSTYTICRHAHDAFFSFACALQQSYQPSSNGWMVCSEQVRMKLDTDGYLAGVSCTPERSDGEKLAGWLAEGVCGVNTDYLPPIPIPCWPVDTCRYVVCVPVRPIFIFVCPGHPYPVCTWTAWCSNVMRCDVL